jgi:hypothetical protein
MQGNLDSPPMIIRASRRISILIAVGSLCFFLFCGLLLLAGRGGAMHILALVFFGLCSAIGVFGVIRPSAVSLGPNGIVVSGGLKSSVYAWRHVSGFRIVMVRHIRMVGFDLSAEHVGNEAWRRANRAAANVDAALPAYLELSADQMLATVLAAQDRWKNPQVSQAS